MKEASVLILKISAAIEVVLGVVFTILAFANFGALLGFIILYASLQTFAILFAFAIITENSESSRISLLGMNKRLREIHENLDIEEKKKAGEK